MGCGTTAEMRQDLNRDENGRSYWSWLFISKNSGMIS